MAKVWSADPCTQCGRTRWNDGSQTQKATDCGAHIRARANPQMREVDGWLMRAEQDRKMGEGDG